LRVTLLAVKIKKRQSHAKNQSCFHH
jgi:hypothetical protein